MDVECRNRVEQTQRLKGRDGPTLTDFSIGMRKTGRQREKKNEQCKKGTKIEVRLNEE